MAQVTASVSHEKHTYAEPLGTEESFRLCSKSKKNGNATIVGIRKGSFQWNRMVRDGLIKE